MWIVGILNIYERMINVMNNSKPLHRHGASYVIGKWLFPSSPRDVRQRKLNTIGIVMLIVLVVAGGVVLTMLKIGKFIGR